jgi:hypothetical protein
MVGAAQPSIAGDFEYLQHRLGFIGFFVFMRSMGIALLGRRSKSTKQSRHQHED